MASAVIHDGSVPVNTAASHGHLTRPNRSRTDEMESMVDDLVDEPPQLARPMYTPSPPVNLGNGTAASASPARSQPASGRFTAADLVRKMKESSPSPLTGSLAPDNARKMSLTANHGGPSTPHPKEGISRPGSSGRTNGSASPSTPAFPSQASHLAGPDTVTFNRQIANMKENIKNRPSPLTGFDPTNTPSSYYPVSYTL